MFFIACPTRGAELISDSRVVSLQNTARGIRVTLACHCGQQHTVLTGRTTERTAALAAA